jgi:uncharacterized membrane protein
LLHSSSWLRDRRALAVLALLAASALCVATLELRIEKTGDSFYRFLIWNLFLAWVPLACAAAAFVRARRRVDALVVALLLLWLLFFPNAPYMLTDFIHVGESPSAPLWYDALMLSSFAWTALLLGFASLYLVQLIVRSIVGAAWSWAVVASALALASFGVYLGRFVRFNSWDALLRPRRVAHVISNQLEDPFQHPRMVAVLVVLTAFLLVGYGVLYAFLELRLELQEPGGAPRSSRAPGPSPLRRTDLRGRR